jgi:hypothetical protein
VTALFLRQAKYLIGLGPGISNAGVIYGAAGKPKEYAVEFELSEIC